MKLICLFFIFFLLTSSFTRKVKKTKNNKININNKIGVAETFDVWIRIDGHESGNQEIKGKMKSAEMLNPLSNPLGLFVDNLEKPSGEIAKIFVKSGDRYYIPHRLISDNWTATPTGMTSRDFIRSSINIDGKVHTLKIKVDFYYIYRNPVTAQELVEMCAKLNSHRAIYSSSIKTQKDQLVIHANAYTTQVAMAESADKGVQQLTAQKNKLNVVIADLEKSNKDLESKQGDIEQKINAKIRELAELQETLKKNTEEQTSNSNKIKLNKDEIETIDKQTSGKGANKDEFVKKSLESKSKFEEGIKNLTKLAPETKPIIEKASEEFGKKNPQGVEKALKEIIAY